MFSNRSLRASARSGSLRTLRHFYAAVAFVLASAAAGAIAATMSASNSLALAIQSDGTLWGWGSRVGDGTSVARLTPIRIDASHDWSDVAAGDGFALAIRSDGSLWGWGDAGTLPARALGNAAVLIPTRIGTASDWSAVNVGPGLTGLIKRDGSLWLWGLLGYASGDDLTAPTRVTTQGTFTAVSCGLTWAYGLRNDGTLWRFGEGEGDQGGVGLVGGLMPDANGSSWQSVTTLGNRRQTYAIAGDGSLWAWGRSSGGSLGFGYDQDYALPTLLDGGALWVAVGAKIALKTDGSLWSWSTAAGDGPSLPQPHQIGIGQSWIAVSGSLARRADGAVYRVGVDYDVNSGLGTPARYSEPKRLGAANQRWTAVAAGDAFAFAVNTDGTLWSWGDIPYPPLGMTYSPEPTLFDAGGGWRSLAAGEFHTLGIKTDGSLWGWGDNSALQLGFPWTSTLDMHASAPRRIGANSDWTQVVATSNVSAGLRSNGTLWRWGAWMSTFSYPLPPPTYAPWQVGTDADWVQVAFIFNKLVARKMDGRIFVIDGATSTQIGQDTDWMFVGATRDGRFVGQKTNGTVYSWSDLPAGYMPNPNNYGVLGDGTTIHRTTPTYIATTKPLVAVVGDSNNTQLIDATGTRIAWTSLLGFGGGLGLSQYVVWTPYPIQPSRKWGAVSQGKTFSVGIAEGGALFTWEKPPAMTVLSTTKFNYNTKTAVITGAPSTSLVDAIQFRNLSLGVAAPRINLALTNTSDTAIQLPQISLALPFELTHTCPTSLAAGATCALQVGITPAVPGVEFARLHVESDAQISANEVEVWAIASDNVPDAFALGAVSGATPGTLQYATPVVIGGLSNTAAATASNGGRIALNCATGSPVWSSSVVVHNGDTLCVRQRASAVPSAQMVTTVTVGTLAVDFMVTTRDRTPGMLLVSGGYGQPSVNTWGICTSLPPSQGTCWATDREYACEVLPGATGTIHNRDAQAFSITNIQSDLQRNVTLWPGGALAVCRLDIDGDGLLLADKDGIAWLKYLAGYSPAVSLIEGAAATCAVNTTASTQALPYTYSLQVLGLAANDAKATQFGLVLLRAMLGLYGDAATANTSIGWTDFATKVNGACGTTFGSTN